MCPERISDSVRILGYLDAAVNRTYYFEYYINQGGDALTSENFTVERLLNSQIISFSLNMGKEINKVLFENYYYDIELTTKLDEYSIIIDPEKNSEFYDNLSLDSSIPWYVNLSINHNITKLVADSYEKSKRLLGKLENLKKSLLKVYITGEIVGDVNSYREWVAKKNSNKKNLDTFLNMEGLNGESVSGFDAAIKAVIPNFNIDRRFRWNSLREEDGEAREILLREYNEFRQLLGQIKSYRENGEDNEEVDLVTVYSRLMDYDGVGEVALSTLLNTINNKYFPIFSRSLCGYMKMVGFEIDQNIESNRKIAMKYNNYQVGLNQMIQSFGNYLNDHKNSYDALNYYLRHGLKLFEL
ncbi:hypothetical protein [Ruminiclostridium papyrosolvens]|uniref:Uncharacterized protein n=1 Tax=Ruminiclostridium papyrosolvens C7 TaxID=1330534 RepID=U4R1U6_9FIRM|nr:hypothetical protein [Ruminiclostridium papyrosolvens]EPR12200.1 hypothetical protein L323_08850 [Ruminiclostridium papyrosolvens C7]